MKLVILALSLTLLACKTVTTSVTTDENNNVTMKSIEDSLFSCPTEKLRFLFKPDNGGQIAEIFWEGEKMAGKFSESYPNEKNDLKKLQPRVIDDGSGLVVVDSKVRGEFQLRRSYSLQYHEKTDEHIIEVIYNVKNYSSDKEINQKWIQELSLPQSHKVELKRDGLQSQKDNNSFSIQTINIKEFKIEGSNNKLILGNRESFKLGTKERLSWKVLYILKSID